MWTSCWTTISTSDILSMHITAAHGSRSPFTTKTTHATAHRLRRRRRRRAGPRHPRPLPSQARRAAGRPLARRHRDRPARRAAPPGPRYRQPRAGRGQLDRPRYVLQAGEADLSSLRNRLQSEELNERAAAARLKAEMEQARLRADADQEMAQKGLLPELTRRLSKNAADELDNRYKLESERLRVNAAAPRRQIAAPRGKLAQLRAPRRLQEQQLASLQVRAGIDGVLQQVNVEVGQRVTQGASLAKVVRPTQLKAQLRIPETQARDIALGQGASIDTRNGVVKGHVIRIDPASQNATVAVDVGLDEPLPRGARPDLTVDGTIELERMTNVLHVARPSRAQELTSGTVFRLDDAGGATQVKVRYGRGSVTDIEIAEGLHEGDRIITSDTSQWDEYGRVRLN